MDAAALERYRTLRTRLQSLDVESCGMRHERVAREPESGQPVRDCLTDHGFARVAFCSADVRRNRLACAHTTARLALAEALEAVQSAKDGVGKECETLLPRIAELDLQLADLDRRKSDAEIEEARLAGQLATSPDGEELRELTARKEAVQSEIQSLVDRHRECAVALGRLRDRIVELLDEALMGRKQAPPPTDCPASTP